MRAIRRLFAEMASKARRPVMRRAGLAFALLLLFVSSSPRVASADAVDTAVDAFVAAGSIAGVPIPPSAAGVVKELVRCAVSGKPAAECAKESVIRTVLKNVPEEGKAFATCLAAGGDVAKCGIDFS